VSSFSLFTPDLLGGNARWHFDSRTQALEYSWSLEQTYTKTQLCRVMTGRRPRPSYVGNNQLIGLPLYAPARGIAP